MAHHQQEHAVSRVKPTSGILGSWAPPNFSGVWRCKLKILNLKCMQNLLASLLVICYLHHFTYVSCGGWLHCFEHRTFCYTMEKGSNSHVGWGCHMLERQCWFATKSGASEVVHRSHDVAIVLWLCSEDNFSIAYLKNGWTIACCAATWMNGFQDAIEQITWM